MENNMKIFEHANFYEAGMYQLVLRSRKRVYHVSRVTGKGQLWATKKYKEWLA